MNVNFYATLRPLVGGKTVVMPLLKASTVHQLLLDLVGRWPALREHVFEESDELSRRVAVFVDGRDVRWLPEGVATVLTGEELVDVFPPVAGG